MESKFGFGFLTGLGGLTLILVILIIPVIISLIAVWLFWRIFKKAGFPGPLALLMFIPVVNLAMLMVLAFLDWPVYKKFSAGEGDKQIKKDMPETSQSSEEKELNLDLVKNPKILLDKSSSLIEKKKEEEDSNKPLLKLPSEKDAPNPQENQKEENNKHKE